MHRRWAALAATAVLLMGADNGCGKGQGQHEPHAIVPVPAAPPTHGRCGIPSAGPGVGTCHGPYTYYFTADARGISDTTTFWFLGLEPDILESGIGLDEHSISFHKTIAVRTGAGIVITAARYAKYSKNYGAGCTLRVRDRLGEEVGTDRVVTRPAKPFTNRPYDTAHCDWA